MLYHRSAGLCVDVKQNRLGLAVNLCAAVANLGSDPNLAQYRQIGAQRLTKLGSDPNFAGHTLDV